YTAQMTSLRRPDDGARRHRLLAWVATAVLVVLIGGSTLFLLRGPIAERLPFPAAPAPGDRPNDVDRTIDPPPLDGAPNGATAEEAAPTRSTTVATGGGTDGGATPTAPTRVRWTLSQVSTALQEIDLEVEALLDAAPSELEPLVASSETADETSLQIRQRRLATWARAWRNRVAVPTRAMPPTDACRVHAGMAPACATYQEVLVRLAQVAGAVQSDDLERGLALIEKAAARRQAFLEPPPLDDEPVESDDPAAIDAADDASPDAQA
ncbi:MAG: hypothetical protein AAGN46_08510, partial [Acidobacteriota bacterium]